MIQNVTVGEIDADWPGTVAEYIRHNDEAVLRATDKLLNAYQNDFLTCGSFDEFCDVAGEILLSVIAVLHDRLIGYVFFVSRFIRGYSISR